MEYEVRYYFSKDKFKTIISKLEKKEDLKKQERCYEKTIQYDNPNPQFSFYCKEIDGRFRVRVTKNDSISKCKISWKRRILSTTATDINKEEEIELNIQYNEYDNLMLILDNVLKMRSVESYERYRTIFTNDDIEIAVDEYPFGIALEIENKSKEKESRNCCKILGRYARIKN